MTRKKERLRLTIIQTLALIPLQTHPTAPRQILHAQLREHALRQIRREDAHGVRLGLCSRSLRCGCVGGVEDEGARGLAGCGALAGAVARGGCGTGCRARCEAAGCAWCRDLERIDRARSKSRSRWIRYGCMHATIDSVRTTPISS